MNEWMDAIMYFNPKREKEHARSGHKKERKKERKSGRFSRNTVQSRTKISNEEISNEEISNDEFPSY